MSAAASLDENDDISSPMTRLENVCASITKQSLSCKTLRKTVPENSSTSHLIQKEMELAEWLDQSIFDCRATVARRDARNEKATTTTTSRQQVRLQQQELLDESAVKQQEHLLLSRIEMATVAQEFVFPKASTDESKHDANTSLLVKEAVQSRDNQVDTSLEMIQELDAANGELRNATSESLRLQQANRKLWQQSGGGSNNKRDTSSDEARAATETRILKRALQDIIVGSDLDWYSDKRLRETMPKLET